MADLEWSDFKVILALSRGGSIAAASRILGVDSSTVSRRLAAAEEALGACLILRGSREFRFTPEGATALSAAEAMEASVVSTAASIKSAKQSIEGVVKLTCVGSMYHVINPISELMRARHPRLNVEVLDLDHLVNLAAGEADVALRMVAPTEPDLVARRAFDLAWCVYASTGYARLHGLPKTRAELREHHLILFSESRLHLEGFRLLEPYKSGPEQFSRVNNTTVALRTALSGAGIVALPAYEGSEELNLLKVFPEPIHIQPAFIVFHESQRDSARIRAVVDGVTDLLASKKQLLLGESG